MRAEHPARQAQLENIQALATEVRDRGEEIGLPYIAVSADIGDPEPMRDAHGRPFAETLFRWLDPDLEYWKDRGFALRSAFVFAASPFSLAAARRAASTSAFARATSSCSFAAATRSASASLLLFAADARSASIATRAASASA